MKHIIIILTGIILALNFAAAGEILTIPISGAIELALRNNSQLKQIAQDVAIAKAQYNQSFADFALPKLSAAGSLTYLDPATVSNGILDSFSFQDKPNPKFGSLPLAPAEYTNVFADNYSAGVSLTKTIFAGFRLKNSLRVREINLDLANKKYDYKKKEIIYGTQTQFYNLFLLKERINLSEDQNNTLSNQMRNIQLNFDNGSASEYDKIRVEVLFKNNQPKILAARSAYKTSKMVLCDSIGIKDYDKVEFIGNLMEFTNLDLANITESNAVELALSNDINLKTIDYNLEMLRFNKEIGDGVKYPVLSAFFNLKEDFNKSNMTNAERSWNTSWNTGLQLAIPIDDWLPMSKTANSAKEFEANIKKNLEIRSQASDETALQVRSLLMQLEVSRVNITSQLDSLKQARLGLDVANKRYSAGVGLASDVIDSETSYSQAESAYLQAIYDYYSSMLKLKLMIGE